ncbi:MAG TPA: hypothetical protein VLI70_05870 [Micrococcaceae bacterium]|nr:hypothetical protein [Micrococcaceae bacterium]
MTSPTMTRPWLRWLPAAVVPAVIAAGALVTAFQAGAAVELPAKTPEQVLAMVAAHQVHDLSGTLEQTSDLGLPQLPSSGSSSHSSSANSSTANILDLLTSPHTARIYLDGPANVRVQVMDTLAERDFVRHGKDLWLYSSKDNSATHVALPDRAATDGTKAPGTRKPETRTPGMMQTPEELARHLLAKVGPSTDITVGRDAMVAGRSAYDLVLTPRASDTLIGSVSLAVDSATGLPLSVEVLARGQDQPAFRLAFTDLNLDTPQASLFSFTPPPGATVKEQTLPAKVPAAGAQQQAKPGASGSDTHKAGHPQVNGTGWDAVAELPSSALPPSLLSSPLLAQATRSVDGGRLLSTALVNVLITNDGRIFAGSVPLERLQSAAASG